MRIRPRRFVGKGLRYSDGPASKMRSVPPQRLEYRGMWIIFYPEADGSIDWDAIVAAKRDIDKGHKAGLLSDAMAA